MKIRSLKKKILISFFAVIALFAASIAWLGSHTIQKNIIERSQRQVKNDLRVARWAYDSEIEKIQAAFNLVGSEGDLGSLKDEIGLDYIDVVDRGDLPRVKSEVVREAFNGRPIAGVRIIEPEELARLSPSSRERAVIKVRPTPMAGPTDKTVLERAMAVGYAKPIFDETGRVRSVIYGGRVLNRDFELVDKIRDIVFEDQMYGGKPIGTVTIFLDDVRIATNVLDGQGERAVGTRVSERVYQKVVIEGKPWVDRAFVVTDWYLTAYEPIRNIQGQVVGILYVGLLEKPFVDMGRKLLLVFLAVVGVASLLAAVLSLILANGIARPVRVILDGIKKVSKGDLRSRVSAPTSLNEFIALADAFNDMARKLDERQQSLDLSRQKLEALNKSYLDLIGFVAHELKGILASTIMNAYTVRDGHLGMVNFKQQRMLDAVARNLDYFDATVKNFLNLSRIEKGELEPRRVRVRLKEDLLEPAFDAFLRQAQEKKMVFRSRVPEGLSFQADGDLMRIVVNNLISNAVKYGRPGTEVVVSAETEGDFIRMGVLNQGEPIAAKDQEKLFKKFSRIRPETDPSVQGTGLGLFVTREIVERHGGMIWLDVQNEGNEFMFKIGRG